MATTMVRNIIRLGSAARTAQDRRDAAYSKLADAARAGVEAGLSQSEVARHAGVDRQTVRNWIGRTSRCS